MLRTKLKDYKKATRLQLLLVRVSSYENTLNENNSPEMSGVNFYPFVQCILERPQETL